jgi:DNA end-binding protein Ku
VQSARGSLKSSELKLAERLIEGLSKDEFGAEQFEDTHRRKILKLAREKVAGEELTIAPARRPAKTIDLMKALKDSLATKPSNRRKQLATAVGGPSRREGRADAFEVFPRPSVLIVEIRANVVHGANCRRNSSECENLKRERFSFSTLPRE